MDPKAPVIAAMVAAIPEAPVGMDGTLAMGRDHLIVHTTFDMKTGCSAFGGRHLPEPRIISCNIHLFYRTHGAPSFATQLSNPFVGTLNGDP